MGADSFDDETPSRDRAITVNGLRESLEKVPQGCRLVANAVGNLMILAADRVYYIGYICMWTGKVELFNDDGAEE